MKNRPFVPCYFAGSFSGNGFANYLPESIKEMKKIYIIKGTPGSGKSTLMKKIALAAKENGEETEKIYCSSDPTSLDGVVIPSLSFAIVDGTAPHVMDASYPVAVETIINTGDYLNQKEIEEHRDDIISLANEKKRLFAHSEGLLRSALAIEMLKTQILEECYNSGKGFKFCKSVILKEAKYKKEGETVKRNCFTFCKDGLLSLNAFPDAKRVYSVNEKFAPFILGTLKLLALEYKIPAIYSPCPVNTADTGAVYFPLSQTLFVSSAYKKDGENISDGRFALSDILKKNKEKLKFLSKTEKVVLSEAKNYLFEAMEKHKALEKIYVSSLNKDGLNCLTESIIISLFG